MSNQFGYQVLEQQLIFVVSEMFGYRNSLPAIFLERKITQIHGLQMIQLLQNYYSVVFCQ